MEIIKYLTVVAGDSMVSFPYLSRFNRTKIQKHQVQLNSEVVNEMVLRFFPTLSVSFLYFRLLHQSRRSHLRYFTSRSSHLRLA